MEMQHGVIQSVTNKLEISWSCKQECSGIDRPAADAARGERPMAAKRAHLLALAETKETRRKNAQQLCTSVGVLRCVVHMLRQLYVWYSISARWLLALLPAAARTGA